jgi:hypothetical protein
MPKALGLTYKVNCGKCSDVQKFSHRPPRPPVERIGAVLLERAGEEKLGVEVERVGEALLRDGVERPPVWRLEDPPDGELELCGRLKDGSGLEFLDRCCLSG